MIKSNKHGMELGTIEKVMITMTKNIHIMLQYEYEKHKMQYKKNLLDQTNIEKIFIDSFLSQNKK